jgi:transposase InsO family protein
VVRAGYYRWAKRPILDESDWLLLKEIRDVMEESRYTYGVKRVTEELRDRGFHVNHKRVERLMKENNIHPKRRRPFKKTTDSDHKFPASEDRLRRRFDVNKPNRVWVSDITYLKTSEGWLYLCAWIDLFSRAVVGWSLSTSLKSRFVCDALTAGLSRRPGARPLVHSDRGVQYASNVFRQLLWRNKLRQSMSRKGNCWDNAVAESFFSTLKTELDLRPSMPAAMVRQLVFEYIEVFYNRKRLHSKLGYKSPLTVEREYWSLLAAS